jgi:hypothetical protein
MARWLALLGLGVALALAGSAAQAEDEKPGRRRLFRKAQTPKLDLEALFRKLDVNGDGKLSPEEFSKLADHLPAQPARRFNLREKLGTIDPARLEALRELFGKGKGEPEKKDDPPKKDEPDRPRDEK